MNKLLRLISLSFFLLYSLAASAQSSELHIVATGDVHGAWFHKSYVDGSQTRTSLMSVKHYVDSLRNAVGKDNVLLIDAGDCLQGDNASYFYNYIASDRKHLFPKICRYMGYDAVVVGNHDVETGHAVYDKVAREMEAYGIPWLSGSYLKTTDGTPYFPMYRTFLKAGKKVMVLGFGNANIKAWLSEELWDGISIEPLVPFVCTCVEYLRSVENPDVVVVAVHSGTGKGDGAVLESQGLDLLHSLKGVDVLICGHDHRTLAAEYEGTVLLNAGSKAGYIGHSVISFEGGEKTVRGASVRLDKDRIDTSMERRFRKEYEAVRDFTVKEIGTLSMEMRTRDAFRGMCDYINLIHTVQLGVPEADISIAAPLTYNGVIKKGALLFNDMFTIYPYENQLFVVRMSGVEIKDYLEYSYDKWIQTPGDHVLNIEKVAGSSTAADRWSFRVPTYNLDSAAGICYTVDVSKPKGERVSISGLAGGKPFDPSAGYNVAMTSYRASGGGNLMPEGAKITADELDGRIVAKYPEIRDLIYRFVADNKELTPELTGDRSVLGSWKFVPESVFDSLVGKDMELLF